MYTMQEDADARLWFSIYGGTRKKEAAHFLNGAMQGTYVGRP